MRHPILRLFALGLAAVLLSGCGHIGGGEYERKQAAAQARYLEILDAHRDELTAQLDTYSRVADLLKAEIPVMNVPVQIELADSLGNSGNTLIELKAGFEQLADPDFSVRDARKIYTANAGELRPHLRPEFFSSALAETKAAFDNPEYRDYPDALEELVERLRRVQYILVIGGYYRGPEVFKEGDPMSVGIGPPISATEPSYRSADVDLKAWLVDVTHEKLLGAVKIKARNIAREVRFGKDTTQIKQELEQEVERYLQNAINAAVDWFESGGQLHKLASGVESAKDRPWFLQPADENPVWEVIPLPEEE